MKIFIFISIVLLFFAREQLSYVPDTAINQIELVDPKSVLNILGKDCWNALIEDSDYVKIIVYNNEKTEKLELIFHEGDNLYNFSEFRISQIYNGYNSTKHKFLTLNEEHFESARGIKLGMTPKSVESKLGLKLERTQKKNGKLVLYFRKKTDKDPAFKRYNMPIYYGEYIFQNEKLIAFSFGFEQM